MQALFQGSSEYREVARFGEGYFMPEYVLVDWLIGNRSRNYLSEIAIFRRDQPGSEDLPTTHPQTSPHEENRQ